MFRPKGPAVQIAWPSGPGKSPPNRRPGPTGRQFISSACRMADPLGLKIFFVLVDLALRARLLEQVALWAGNAGEWSSEFFSEKQHSQRLLSRVRAAERNAPFTESLKSWCVPLSLHTPYWNHEFSSSLAAGFSSVVRNSYRWLTPCRSPGPDPGTYGVR